MKKLYQKVSDLFKPKEYMALDAFEVLEALGDEPTRKLWLFEVLSEVKRLHTEIDQRLNEGKTLDMVSLSARRRALQFVLEAALAAKREVQRARGHNPPDETTFDLESVTVQPSPH